MNAPAQRATFVLEHMSATEDAETEKSDRPWSVVAYLVYDSGQRRRCTIAYCGTREEASAALENLWDTMTG